MKRCQKCRATKPVSEFWARVASLDGLQKRCKECQQDTQRERLYGVTREQWDASLERFNYACANCGDEDDLCLDHNHKTSEPRGILCAPCNKALGLLRECPDRIRGLALYAQLHGGR